MADQRLQCHFFYPPFNGDLYLVSIKNRSYALSASGAIVQLCKDWLHIVYLVWLPDTHT